MQAVLEKYHGLGNDYFVFDPNKNELELTKDRVQRICNRNMGLGSDGILEGPIMDEKTIRLKIWNPDGTVAEKSGNGVLIFAKYLKDAGYVQKKTFTFATDGGEVGITYLNEDGSRLRVAMGQISFWSDVVPVAGERREVINEDMVLGNQMYPVTCVSVGNPQCVIPMRRISKAMVCKVGADAEKARYFPNKVNTQLMKVIDKENVEIEIYERGAGYTLASGTGACATAAVAYKLGMTNNKINVRMPGGILQVEIAEDWTAQMTGEVVYLAEIRLSTDFVEILRSI